MTRIYTRLTRNDLILMRDFALEELDRFLHRAGSPPGKFSIYSKRLIAICLCQGAAQHYLQSLSIHPYHKTVCIENAVIRQKGYRLEKDGTVLAGIRDIDIWFFFYEYTKLTIPHIRNCKKSTSKSFDRLGHQVIDFMKKTITKNIVASAKSERPTDIIRSYLQNANTLTSEYLACASVVGLYPNVLLGRHIWKVQWINRHPLDLRRRGSRSSG